MALINRVTRLFKSDFHAVLDRIEEPEQVLRQAIRDMEDELNETEQRIQACAHEQERLGNRKAELEARRGEIDEELDLCFAKKKEDLARSLVRRKLEAERLLKRVDAKLAADEKALAAERARLDENRSTLEGLRQKAEVFTQRAPAQPTDEFDERGWMARELVVSEDEIEVAFLREQQARSGS